MEQKNEDMTPVTSKPSSSNTNSSTHPHAPQPPMISRLPFGNSSNPNNQNLTSLWMSAKPPFNRPPRSSSFNINKTIIAGSTSEVDRNNETRVATDDNETIDMTPGTSNPSSSNTNSSTQPHAPQPPMMSRLPFGNSSNPNNQNLTSLWMSAKLPFNRPVISSNVNINKTINTDSTKETERNNETGVATDDKGTLKPSSSNTNSSTQPHAPQPPMISRLPFGNSSNPNNENLSSLWMSAKPPFNRPVISSNVNINKTINTDSTKETERNNETGVATDKGTSKPSSSNTNSSTEPQFYAPQPPMISRLPFGKSANPNNENLTSLWMSAKPPFKRPPISSSFNINKTINASSTNEAERKNATGEAPDGKENIDMTPGTSKPSSSNTNSPTQPQFYAPQPPMISRLPFGKSANPNNENLTSLWMSAKPPFKRPPIISSFNIHKTINAGSAKEAERKIETGVAPDNKENVDMVPGTSKPSSSNTNSSTQSHAPQTPMKSCLPFGKSANPNNEKLTSLRMSAKPPLNRPPISSSINIHKTIKAGSTSEVDRNNETGVASDDKENINTSKSSETPEIARPLAPTLPVANSSTSGKVSLTDLWMPRKKVSRGALLFRPPQLSELVQKPQSAVTTTPKAVTETSQKEPSSSDSASTSQVAEQKEVAIRKQKPVPAKKPNYPDLTDLRHFRYEEGELLPPEEMIWITTELINNCKTLAMVTCNNCLQVFSHFQFRDHVCRFDEAGKLLPGEHVNACLANEIKDLLKSGERTMRLMNENRTRLYLMGKGIINFENSWPPRTHKYMTKENWCHLCNKGFKYPAALFDHHMDHKAGLIDLLPSASSEKTKAPIESEIVLQCEICGHLAFNMAEVRAHFVQQHFNATYLEPSAHTVEEVRSYMKTETLRTPLSKATATKSPLQCELCDFVCLDRIFLRFHMTTHVARRPLECRACNIYVETSNDLKVHFENDCAYLAERKRDHPILGNTRFVCNACNDEFPVREKLFQHRFASQHLYPVKDLWDNAYVLPCQQCLMLSETTEVAIAHHRGHWKPRPVERRPYLCDICGKTYTQSSHLWQHRHTHARTKQHTCDFPRCNRKFFTRCELTEHKRRLHTTDRPYKCRVCNVRFKTSAVLYQHRLKHQGKRFQCDTCDKKFYRCHALKNHMRVHTGERPFECMHCGKRFRQRSDFKTHVRRMHARMAVKEEFPQSAEQRRIKKYFAAFQRPGGISCIEGWEINWENILKRLDETVIDEEEYY